MCNKAVDASLLALNVVPDWIVTNEMIKKHSDNTIFVNKDSANNTFLCVDLNNINLDHNNFNEDDAKVIIHLILVAWYNKYEQRKSF